ncbi:glutathione S-transferase A-like [Garra rufa]|uniref:glutathione S-transferase A-like n=1 Tax=Garra rufa TaxID=137080 RepID=UPI003CCEB7B1
MFETLNLQQKMYDVAFYGYYVPEEERLESALKRNKENLITELKLWEGYLEKMGKGSYLAGKNFTMADVVCFPVIAYFPRLHCPKERCPRLMEYYEMLKDRPSIKASWPLEWLEKPEGQDTLKNL